MKNRKIKILPISVVCLITAAAVGLGTGLGVGLNTSKQNTGIPGTPFTPTTETLYFKTQKTNSIIGNVLAVNTTALNITTFPYFNYVQSASPEKISVYNNAGPENFIISSGTNALLANSFARNQHFYVPIHSSDGGKATYMKLEVAVSDNGANHFLYASEIGYFNDEDIFIQTFALNDLGSQNTFDLALRTSQNPQQVPQPTSPNSVSFAFNTHVLGTGEGRILLNNLTITDNVSDLLYLKSSDPTSINFAGDNISDANGLNVTLLTGVDNLVKYYRDAIYLPIKPITINSIDYKYVHLDVIYAGDHFIWFFSKLSPESNQNQAVAFLQNLSVGLLATLNFAEGN